MSRTWTHQQEAVFRWVALPGPRRNLLVRARAGTGKTTTIIEALKHAPERAVLLAAFNKRIAAELQARAPRGVRVRTLHSVGLAAITAAWGRLEPPSASRAQAVASEVMRAYSPDGYDAAHGSRADQQTRQAVVFKQVSSLVARLAAIGKRTLSHQVEALEEMAEEYDIEPAADLREAGWTSRHVAKLASRAMWASTERSSVIDYDDMLWIPYALRLPLRRSPLVVIDEAQDMNRAQLAVARAAVADGGRCVVVGDDRQAIYAFMGAAPGALDDTRDALDADELRLSVTFRCPARVVAAARVYVPDYEAAPGAPAGVVDAVPMLSALPRMAEGDFVLSRTNAGAVKACLALLRLGTRATVLGRDIGATIKAHVRALGASTVPALVAAAFAWAEGERANAEAADRPELGEHATDICEALLALAEGMPSVEALVARIDALFDDAAVGKVACCTVHKSKGLEARRVWILAFTFNNKPGVDEENLRYVAITRSLAELYFVGDLGPFGRPFAAAAAFEEREAA